MSLSTNPNKVLPNRVENIGYQLFYSSELEVIFCKTCESLIVIDQGRNSVKNHLQKHKITISSETLANIEEHISGKSLRAPDNLPVVNDYIYYFDILPVLSGFICLECNEFRSTNRKKTRVHLNNVHGLKSADKTDRFMRKYIKEAELQTLSQAKQRIKYYIIKGSHTDDIVSTLPQPATLPISSTTTSVNDLKGKYLTAFNRIERHSLIGKERETTTGTGPLTREYTSFLNNFKWHLYYEKVDLPATLKLVGLVAKESEELLNLVLVLAVETCYKAESSIDKVTRRLRQSLKTEDIARSSVPGVGGSAQSKNLKSFIRLEKPTKAKYYRTFGYLIVYLTRYISLTRLKDSDIGKRLPFRGLLEGLKDISLTNSPPSLYPIIDRQLEQLIVKLVEEAYSLLASGFFIRRGQGKTTENMSILEDNRTERFEYLLLAIVDNLLSQKLTQSTLADHTAFQSPLITYFILISFNATSYSLRDESEISQVASQLIYTLRLTALDLLVRHRSEIEKESPNTTVLDILDDIDLSRTEFETYFNNYYIDKLTNSSNNAFEEIVNIRAYASRIAREKPRKSRIADISQDVVMVDNTEIKISTLGPFFKGILTHLELILFQDLIEMESNDLDSFPIDRIKDNPPFPENNFYFYKYTDKGYDITRFAQILIDRLFEPGLDFSARYIKSRTRERIIFEPSRVATLINNRDRFVRLLALAIYLVSGSPIRGTEVSSITYKNSVQNGLRMLTIEPKFNLVRIATLYSKTYNITRRSTNNIRFLPQRLSAIVKIYLTVFLPFYNFVLSSLDNEEITFSPFLLEKNGIPLTGTDISNELIRESLQDLGVKLSLNPYRHLIIFIIKNRILLDYASDNSSDEEDKIEDIQANHSTKTADIRYGRETAQPIFSLATLESRSLDFNRSFFRFFDLDNTEHQERIWKRKRTIGSIDIRPPKKASNAIQRDINDDLASYYAVTSPLSSHTNQQEQEEQVQPSTPPQTSYMFTEDDNLAYEFDGLSPFKSLGVPALSVRSSLPRSSRRKERDFIKGSTITKQSKSNVLEGLQGLLSDPKAKFKSEEQRKALEAIVDNTDPYLAFVSGTGSGKSLLFFLPYFLDPGRIYIIASPRTALLDDLARRAQAFGLQYTLYTANISDISSNLILLSYESLLDQGITTFITNARAKDREIVLYIDEVHALLLETKFRPIFLSLSSIVKLKIKMVILSATLPFNLLMVLETFFNIDSFRTIRSSTTRSNIEYNVIPYGSGARGEPPLSVLRKLLDEEILPIVNRDDKAFIVFTNAKKEAKMVGEALGIPYLTADLSKEYINETLTRFQRLEFRGIAATSLLAYGLDNPRLAFAVLYKRLYSLIEEDQKIGRIGRSNYLSNKAFFVVDPGVYQELNTERVKEEIETLEQTTTVENKQSYNYKDKLLQLNLDLIRKVDQNALIDVIKEKKCVRITFERYFNERTVSACPAEVNACYLCLKRNIRQGKSKEIELDLEHRSDQGYSQVITSLTTIETRCLICLARGDIVGHLRHSTASCNLLRLRQSNLQAIKDLITGYRLITQGHGCYKCFLPATICDNQDRSITVCNYANLMVYYLDFLSEVAVRYGLYSGKSRHQQQAIPNIGSSKLTIGWEAIVRDKLKPATLGRTRSIVLISDLAEQNFIDYCYQTIQKKNKDRKNTGLTEEADTSSDSSASSTSSSDKSNDIAVRRRSTTQQNLISTSTSSYRLIDELEDQSDPVEIIDLSKNTQAEWTKQKQEKQIQSILRYPTDKDPTLTPINMDTLFQGIDIEADFFSSSFLDIKTRIVDLDSIPANTQPRIENLPRGIVVKTMPGSTTTIIETLDRIVTAIPIHKCVFCFYHIRSKGSDESTNNETTAKAINHATQNCKQHKSLVEQANTGFALARSIYGVTSTSRQSFQDPYYIKGINYDANCFLPFRICFQNRNRQGGRSICLLEEEIKYLIFLIFSKQLNPIIPAYYSLTGFKESKIKGLENKSFWNWLSNKAIINHCGYSNLALLLLELDMSFFTGFFGPIENEYLSTDSELDENRPELATKAISKVPRQSKKVLLRISSSEDDADTEISTWFSQKKKK